MRAQARDGRRRGEGAGAARAQARRGRRRGEGAGAGWTQARNPLRRARHQRSALPGGESPGPYILRQTDRLFIFGQNFPSVFWTSFAARACADSWTSASALPTRGRLVDKFMSHLHYRLVDVSTVTCLPFCCWGLRLPQGCRCVCDHPRPSSRCQHRSPTTDLRRSRRSEGGFSSSDRVWRSP